MHKFYFFLLLILVFFLVNSACNIINPSEDIPAYIHIDSVTLTQPSTGYYTTQNITDVWINIDGNKAGTYQLPATFPIIAEGKHHITVRAGIKDNGVSASRVIYPFYTFFELDTNFVPKQTINLTPNFEYKDGLTRWIETFEDPGYKFELTSKSDTNLQRITDPRNPNEKVGAFYLSPDKPLFQCVSTDAFNFEYNGAGIYLEIDYQCDQEFVVGLYVNKASQTIETPIIYLNAHPDSFNKVYVNLLYIVSQNPDALDFNVFVAAERVDSIDYPKIYFDNLTVVYP